MDDKDKDDKVVTHGIMGGYGSPFGGKKAATPDSLKPSQTFVLQRMYVSPKDRKKGGAPKRERFSEAAARLLREFAKKFQ
jgi:hypothetical protein